MGYVYTYPHVPWVPTREDVIELLLRILKLSPGDVFADVGCGDGRVAIAFARRFGVEALCIEARRELVERARELAKRAGVSHLVKVIEADFFKVPLTSANVVYMYLLTSVNQKLRPKLEAELKPGSLVLTLDFPIPEWRPVKVVELSRTWQRTIYVYVVGYSDRRLEEVDEEALRRALSRLR